MANHRVDKMWIPGRHHHGERIFFQEGVITQHRRDLAAPGARTIHDDRRYILLLAGGNDPILWALFNTNHLCLLTDNNPQLFGLDLKGLAGQSRIGIAVSPAYQGALAMGA